MNDQELRLECLKLASAILGTPVSAAHVVESAELLLSFCQDQSRTPPASTRGTASASTPVRSAA